ncbi:hypothetical protein ACFVUY_40220 [Kitasatospora sp. NPDC058063]|uniref:hypothetical protein n=1 Tax=unclassified Kitasatospora TaxID=2633591 RepID=UPI0036DA502D
MLLPYSKLDPLYPPGRCVYAQVIIRNASGGVFQVTTNADDNRGWDVPTWRAIRDQAPHDAARHAARRDASLDVDTLRLLVVDTTPTTETTAEAYWLVFDGGTLRDEQISCQELPKPGEVHDGMRFTDPNRIPSGRIQAALRRLADPSAPVLLADGHPVT